MTSDHFAPRGELGLKAVSMARGEFTSEAGSAWRAFTFERRPGSARR